MKYIFLILFSLLSVFHTHADERVGLTLIPPGKISNKINLDIRGGIVNHGKLLLPRSKSYRRLTIVSGAEEIEPAGTSSVC